MTIMPIPYEERIGRVRRGLPSDPAVSALMLQEVASLRVDVLFSGEQRKMETFLKPLRVRGIAPFSPLGMAAAAFKRAMGQNPCEQPELRAAGVALAEALAQGGGSARKRAVSDLGSGSSCPSSRGARRGGTDLVPLSQLMDSVKRPAGHLRGLQMVRKLSYAAFLEAVDEATGECNAPTRRGWLEENYNVGLRLEFETLMHHATEFRDSSRFFTLIDYYALAPFADAFDVLGGACGVR